MAAWPVEWHENNLKNFKASLAQKQAECDRMVGEIARWTSEMKRMEEQIAAAKKAGKKSFDPDKFMKRQFAASRSE